MLKIICVKGNNRSGKDTFSDSFIKEFEDKGYKVHRLTFANLLKNSLRELYSHRFISLNNIDVLNSDLKDCSYVNTYTGELITSLTKGELFDYPFPIFDHTNVDFSVYGIISVRELMIYHGENVIKKQYGKGFFVKEALNNYINLFKISEFIKDIIVITDLRFKEEEEELLNMVYNYPYTKVYSVTVERPNEPYNITFETEITNSFNFQNKFDKNSTEYQKEVNNIIKLIGQ